MSIALSNTLDAKRLKLKQVFADLSSGYVNNSAPVRFDYIQSLYQRLSSHHNEANGELLDKIQMSADDYMADLRKARSVAANTLEEVSANFPAQTEAAKVMFDQCQFRQLEQLSNSLIKQQSADANIEMLRDLTKSINLQLGESDGADDNQPMSFDKVLYQQEQNARQVRSDSMPVSSDGSGEQLVMQSMKHFRQSMKHFNIDKIIARAIDEGPENPGPLNPQMLAIRSLTQMRDLSPTYLRRFAGHIEALLWLEKNTSKLINAKVKVGKN
ncbi:MAG: DUF2894 domain-containing protein [Arenicella sp.]|nr:DUF2894 domain-containing protein [Arenicella sp.]